MVAKSHTRAHQILDKLSIAVNALRDVLVAKEQLEGDVWRTDSLTRARIFQSSQMPVRPSIPEIIDSLRECIDRQADDSWIRHRTRTEVELYHDVVRASRADHGTRALSQPSCSLPRSFFVQMIQRHEHRLGREPPGWLRFKPKVLLSAGS